MAGRIDAKAGAVTQLGIEGDDLQFQSQFLATGNDPIESGAEASFLTVEAADQIVPLPAHPIRRATEVQAGVEVESIVDEVARLGVDAVTHLVVARETAAECFQLVILRPVTIA